MMAVLETQDLKPSELVLLTAGGKLSNIVINRLATHFGRIVVLREEPESKWTILSRRARLVGPIYAIGQALCGVALKLVGKSSRGRISEICTKHGLIADEPINIDVVSIGSVNSDRCRQLLEEIDPRVVAVYGTRIIGKGTLASVSAPFINYHAGITPKYRGQHPAYWALVENDPKGAGVTVHLVDEGVDTGAVLYQDTVCFVTRDNITTYQYVQMVTALPLFVRAIEDAFRNQLTPKKVDLPSKKWFPPTLLKYALNGLVHKIW